MEIGLDQAAEQQAQHVEKAADRILKGAGLITLAGLVLGKSLESAQYIIPIISIPLQIAALIAACFLVATAGPAVTFGVAAYDPTKNMQNWKPVAQTVFGLVFASVFTAVVVGLFYGEKIASAMEHPERSEVMQRSE